MLLKQHFKYVGVLSVMHTIKIILSATPLLLCILFFLRGLVCGIKIDSHLCVQMCVYRSRHLCAAVSIACMFWCLESFETDGDAWRAF